MAENIKNLLFDKLNEKQLNVISQAAAFAEKKEENIYLIGGIVRDLLLSNPIFDIDIVTECNAAEFAKELSRHIKCEILNIQENLKTAKVKFENGEEIDFASTREEKYIESGMLPVAFNFGCPLKNDVKRRDFTINTLAIKLTGDDKYTLVDYYNGCDDILNKQIKILHPKSFEDDPSRIIRALKFAIRFNFCIEKDTYLRMQKYLKNISTTMPLERIKSELKQYFSLKQKNIYEKLIQANAYKLISENAIKTCNISKLEEIKKYNLFNQDDIWFIYFAAVCINSNFNDERLNLNNTEKRILSETKQLLESKISKQNTKKEIYDSFIKCNNLSIACFYTLTDDTSAVDLFLKELKNIKIQITGSDLINLGLKPSPMFNKIFNEILQEKLNGKIKTKEDELDYAKSFIKAD